MIKLLIIADDFTGALDTGVQFTNCGAKTHMMIGTTIDYDEIAPGVEVLVVDAEVRHLSGNEAGKIVFSIVKNAKAKGIPGVYIKTDSALRGNVGAELEAALKASKQERLHFIPAYPEMGRTTVNGIHYIDGIPVSESVFGHDPFEPVQCSNIKNIINLQTDIHVNTLGNKVINNNCDLSGILVYDSKSTEDIDNIVKSLVENNELGILAGCAGFAGVLAKKMKWAGNKSKIPVIGGKMLIACGSVNPVSIAQCDYAEKEGIVRIGFTSDQKLDLNWIKSNEMDSFVEKLYDLCKKSNMVILDTSDREDFESTVKHAARIGMSQGRMRTTISTVMSAVLKKLIDIGFNETVFIMGGDSLVSFVYYFEIKEVFPVCEIERGVVLSRFKYKDRMLNVISKSGGFGKKTLFNDLPGMLSKLNERKNISDD